MPSWMPGKDYLVDFRKGDPYTKVDQGFARLPGAGYEALHPELTGLDPEQYPEIAKMRILADVAPYSREYQKHASIVRHQADSNPDLKVDYERIAEQVRQTKESTLKTAKRHFNAPVDTIEGTVKSATAEGVELAEYPGRTFRFSSVGSSMADLSAEMLGRSNEMTRGQAVREADSKRQPTLPQTRSLPPRRTKTRLARAAGKGPQPVQPDCRPGSACSDSPDSLVSPFRRPDATLACKAIRAGRRALRASYPYIRLRLRVQTRRRASLSLALPPDRTVRKASREAVYLWKGVFLRQWKINLNPPGMGTNTFRWNCNSASGNWQFPPEHCDLYTT